MRKIQRILVAVKSLGTQWSPAVAKATQQLIYRVHCDLLLVKPVGFANDIERERRGPRLMVTPVYN